MHRLQTLDHRAQPSTAQDPLAMPRPTAAELNRQAIELSNLGQAIPGDIGRVQQSVRPAEIASKLKKIEKLSKQLRSEIVPDPLR